MDALQAGLWELERRAPGCDQCRAVLDSYRQMESQLADLRARLATRQSKCELCCSEAADGMYNPVVYTITDSGKVMR